jgi:D-alanyl-D-alanine carboxypeptidase/D-alanyl-D-alanine-endopeptidase (penicillin-binding protein 4)
VLGVDGTLFNIQNGSPAAGKVHAKTGTNGSGDMLNGRFFLSGKGLAGYMTARSGRHIAFCTYLNNYAGPPREDAMHATGEVLGEIANDGYLDL